MLRSRRTTDCDGPGLCREFEPGIDYALFGSVPVNSGREHRDDGCPGKATWSFPVTRGRTGVRGSDWEGNPTEPGSDVTFSRVGPDQRAFIYLDLRD
jgi:hypothetical protein